MLVVYVSLLAFIAFAWQAGPKKVGVADILILCWDINGLFAEMTFLLLESF